MPIEVELYTTDHLIRGFVETAGERLSDILNLKNESAIVLSRVQVSRLLNVAKSPPVKLALARIDKSSILFAMPVEHDLTHKSIYRRAVRQGYEVIVLLPNFELRGTIHLTERLDVRRVLVVRPEDYVALTNVTAIYVLHPQVTIRAGTVIFNKARTAFIGELPTPPKVEPV